MRVLLLRWLILAFAVWVAGKVVPGITYQDWSDLALAAIILGLINAIIRPALIILSLPLLLFSLGLFLLAINTALFYLVGKIVSGFEVQTWWAAFWGSLIVSVVTTVLKVPDPRKVVVKQKTEHRFDDSPPGKDKVIDV
jgi:putative membrane protein